MKCNLCGHNDCPRLADAGAATDVRGLMRAHEECFRRTVYRADRAQASAAMLAEGWVRLRRLHDEAGEVDYEDVSLPPWVRNCDIIAADALEATK